MCRWACLYGKGAISNDNIIIIIIIIIVGAFMGITGMNVLISCKYYIDS